MKKIAIIGILNNPAMSLNSHSAGMVNIVSCLFNAKILNEDDNWDEFDELIIYHGVNFKKGSFNVMGGINDIILKRCKKLFDFKGEIKTLDGFQLNEFSIKRKLNLYNDYSNILEIELPQKDKLIIGDSHSISIWPNSDYSINRIDGKTLFGFLKDPIKADFYYFGNIDIRFHLPRQSNPQEATLELVKNYIQLAKLHNAKVSCLLPIENEDRKIPSTVLYNKQKFCGTRELRVELCNIFNTELLNSGLNVHVWPKSWYDDINYYQNEVMEPKQSVHIRPKFYAKNLLTQSTLFS
jgi:hypothetical protein